VILTDRPRWPGPRGLGYAHLVSDTSFDELHVFVRTLALPRPLRFHRDHYDVPAPLWQSVVDAGAQVVTTKEIVRVLGELGVRATSAGSARRRRDERPRR
jgi:hypothetical protein